VSTSVVPNQFAVGKNRIIHKPTTATFSFETGHTTFKSIDWGRGDESNYHLAYITAKTTSYALRNSC
jgi:hypothetical protein